MQAGQFASVLLYDTRGLLTSDKPLSVTELNMSPSRVTGVHWNPAIPDMFAVTWEDGRLALFTVSPTGLTDCLTLPPEAGVAAMDWSPKGKQLVVIRRNCDLVQYKPDLSVAKYPKLVEMKTVKGMHFYFLKLMSRLKIIYTDLMLLTNWFQRGCSATIISI